MENQRSAVVELHRAGKSVAEILAALKYPKLRRNFVWRTIKRFTETGDVKDRARSGRPRTATTQQVKKKIASRIARNPQRSMRKMAAELKVSRESVRRVVKRDLGLSPLKLRSIHSLTNASKEKRLKRSRALIRRLAAHGLDSVVFTDEKIFTVEQAFNRQNDRILAAGVAEASENVRNVRRTQKPASVMVWAGVSARGKTQLVFVPEGVKINAQNYEEHILEPVVKHLSQTMFEGGNFLFQQDGAPAHTANRTQNWLRANVPDFLSKEEWPPSSPDLNPMDFCVWSVLEKNACGKPHQTVEALKRSLQREWAKLSMDVVRAAVESTTKRLKEVVKLKGGFIE